MQRNVGALDRIVRIILGLALIGWGYYEQNLWGAVGLIPLATALLSWCPVYLPFGISSRK